MNQEVRILLPRIILERQNSGMPTWMSAIGRVTNGEEKRMEVFHIWTLMMNRLVQLEQHTVELDQVRSGRWREEALVNSLIMRNFCKAIE